MDLAELKTCLSELEKISNEDWLNNLDRRKILELEFHDQHRDNYYNDIPAKKNDFQKRYGNTKFYGGTSLVKQYTDEWIGKNVKNKVFLDYACGGGGYAIKAAQCGAKLSIGIDISQVTLDVAKRNAQGAGVEGATCFLQADAENTRLPRESIDIVICSGMLHHLDLSYAFPELRRILAPGGKILAIESLGYNPLFAIYRKLTPLMRTSWESKHILKLSDIKFAERFFDVGEIKYWHIMSVLEPYMKNLLPLLNLIDGVLTKIPLIQFMSWIFTFELIKKKPVE